jgi:hypothetical protein
MPEWVTVTISKMAVSPPAQRAHEIALEQRGKRLLVLPFRVQRSERLDAIESESKLEIHRLLRPQRAVIVEGRDALGGWHEVG